MIFVTTSGHELGYLGLSRLLEDGVGLFNDVYAWMHFGASFSGKHAYRILQSSDQALSDFAYQAMASRRLAPDELRIAADDLVGEIGMAVNAFGGRYVSLSGINPWFHHEKDRFAVSVDRRKVPDLKEVALACFQQLAYG